MWRQVGDDQGVVAADSDALIVKMADVLDGPVGGKPGARGAAHLVDKLVYKASKKAPPGIGRGL
jgi:hypothetical protein